MATMRLVERKNLGRIISSLPTNMCQFVHCTRVKMKGKDNLNIHIFKISVQERIKESKF